VERLTTNADAKAAQGHRDKMGAVSRIAGGLSRDVGDLVESAAATIRDVLVTIGPDREAHEPLADAAAALQRAVLIARQLEVLARPVAAHPVPQLLGRTVDDLLPLATRLAGPSVTVSADALDPAAWIAADSGQVEQVLFHLVVNARDAMPHGGTLTLRVECRRVAAPLRHRFGTIEPGDWVTLEVRDTGCGMTEPVLTRLFEPFFTTKDPGQGSGLGLATVYGIARQLEGHVMVDSRPHAGSAVTLWLPALAPIAGERSEPVFEGTGVLLVEDDEWVRAVTARALRHAGYGVLEAGDGGAALELLRDVAGQKIRVVLTDIVMPGMSGDDLARRVASERPDVRVVLMTGRAREMLDEGALAGLSVLHKPFSRHQLLAAIGG
jgi:two-component system cell cycle sensor histidine kinase/response regulator CckA